jgi:K(+)-stimulated pyrophosphate-energized sodium pump
MVLVAIVISLVGLFVALLLAQQVQGQPDENEKMRPIAAAIKEGANAFLWRQYKTISALAIVFAVILFAIYAANGKADFGIKTAVAFILGAVSSGIAGWIGMYIAVRANLKTANAADRKDLNKALQIALRGGAVSGLSVVAMSLLGISLLYIFYNNILGYDVTAIPAIIVGYGFGASFVALFAQLGGGIYTKAADVGADLVGKVEAGIPEDDPRNPAVIADLVGDNVGDCAGRGADLFESTAAENIGAMILGVALFPTFGIKGIMFPLIARAFGLIASIIGVLSVRIKGNEDPMKALNRGYYLTMILASVGLFIASKLLLTEYYMQFFLAGMVGVATSLAFVWVTQYYTEYKYRPVLSIAEASKTGPATNIIAGLAVGFENTALPVVVLSVALFLSYTLGHNTGIPQGGIYGTAVATMGMLATAGYILAMDTFGPITDNAGGIVEMSNASEETRKITDRLDAVGNTTKALTKGYAVGSAALAAFLLFSAYLEEVKIAVVDLAKIEVFIGGMFGAMLIFLFSALAMRAVGKTAGYIIEEVRRQFRENPNIMKGTQKPDYARAVDITAKGALRQMVAPGLTAVVIPIAVGLILRAEAEAALLMVGTITGVLMALVMNNGGGAWDNAKKYIEAGNLGGKGSDAHKAAVVGDTVGDPFKDTAGPSLHVVIKLLSTLTLVLAGLFI